MRNITLIYSLLFAPLAYAGYYGDTRVDTYDPVTGLYYRAVDIEPEDRRFISKGSRAQVSNINIFDPNTNKSKLLFTDGKQRIINVFVFETGYENGRINFHGAYRIKNNSNVKKREAKNKLLVGIWDKEKQLTVLWVVQKNGKNISKLTTVSSDSDWHIDVKNSKLRVVKSNDGKFYMESYNW